MWGGPRRPPVSDHLLSVSSFAEHGKPIWGDASLIADEAGAAGATVENAQALLAEVAQSLGVPAENIQPAYEDPAAWLIKEASLPDNVTPDDSKLSDAEERHRMARVFDRGLGNPVGYVLPVQRAQAQAGRWRSEFWRFSRQSGAVLK